MNGTTAVGGEKSRIGEVPGKQNTQCEHLWMEVRDEWWDGLQKEFQKSEVWGEVPVGM